MTRFIIVALGAWLGLGGCSTPLVACPLVADSQPRHGCCPHLERIKGSRECDLFLIQHTKAKYTLEAHFDTEEHMLDQLNQ
jgi:hypothetical protein